MSRLSASVEKPFTKTLQWKNEKFDKKTKSVTQEKGWYYYVKSEVEGEKGTNIMLEAPFTFVWLTSATSFTGYNEAENKSIYSNEVLSEKDLKELFKRNSNENVEDYYSRIKSYMSLRAKLGDEEIATGLYKDIKDQVVAKGGKYCQPVYGLLITNEGTEIVRFLMSGSSSQTWIPFANPHKLRTMGVAFTGETVEQSKGSNDYESPAFKYVPVEKSILKEADEAAMKVNEYFKFLLSESEENLTPAEVAEEDDFMNS